MVKKAVLGSLSVHSLNILSLGEIREAFVMQSYPSHVQNIVNFVKGTDALRFKCNYKLHM